MVKKIKAGDLYEDCGHIPRLCVAVSQTTDCIEGISLVDGLLGTCSPTHCGLVKISVEKALDLRVKYMLFGNET